MYKEEAFMTVSKIFVGVDVSKKTLDVYFYPCKKVYKFANNPEGFSEFVKTLSNFSSIEKIGCEATGGYENAMIKFLRQYKFNVWRVNPRRIKAFIGSEGMKAKTDKIDAKYIALFISQKTQKHEMNPLSDDEKSLQDLSKRRAVIVEIAKQEKTRLQNPDLTELSKECILDHLKFLKDTTDKLNDKIKSLLKESKNLQEKAAIIISMPCLGDITAAVLLAELPELGHADDKQIAALAGVAPYQNQSGMYQGLAKTSGGRKVIRKALYMVALTASRHNLKFKISYQKFLAAGKKPKVALVALIRKILCVLNAMIKKGEVWNPAI